jgi:hypothetical protein
MSALRAALHHSPFAAALFDPYRLHRTSAIRGAISRVDVNV